MSLPISSAPPKVELSKMAGTNSKSVSNPEIVQKLCDAVWAGNVENVEKLLPGMQKCRYSDFNSPHAVGTGPERNKSLSDMPIEDEDKPDVKAGCCATVELEDGLEGAKRTLLHLAARKYDANAVKLARYLLKREPSLVEKKNEKGDTVLHIAARNLSVELMKVILVQPRLKINAKNEDGYTALDVSEEHFEQIARARKITEMWKSQRIALKLRLAGAKTALLDNEEDEEEWSASVLEAKRKRDAEEWKEIRNTAVIAATLALTLGYAAMFAALQISGSNLKEDVEKTGFQIFIFSVSGGCLVSLWVIAIGMSANPPDAEMQALHLFVCMHCLSAAVVSLIVAYVAALILYVGAQTTLQLVAFWAALAVASLFIAWFLHIFQSYIDLYHKTMFFGASRILCALCLPHACTHHSLTYLARSPN